MLQIIGLLVALGGVAALARGRGASPVLTVVLALAGFLTISVAGGSVASTDDARIAVMLFAWGWVGAVALYVRFIVGRGRPSPTGSWICANCRTMNEPSANVCVACQQPWAPAQ